MKKSMWKSLLIVWISLVPFNGFAEQKAFKCGEYEIFGVIRKVDGENVIKIYEHSQSEAILSLSPDLAELADMYLDQAVILKGKILIPIKNYRGTAESLLTAEELQELTSPEKPYTARLMREDIRERVADPYRPDADSGLKMMKPLPCRAQEKK